MSIFQEALLEEYIFYHFINTPISCYITEAALDIRYFCNNSA